jgi:hypothetical protein
MVAASPASADASRCVPVAVSACQRSGASFAGDGVPIWLRVGSCGLPQGFEHSTETQAQRIGDVTRHEAGLPQAAAFGLQGVTASRAVHIGEHLPVAMGASKFKRSHGLPRKTFVMAIIGPGSKGQMEQDMTVFWTPRPSQDDIDRWIAYFRQAPGVTAERAEFARDLLVESLVRMGAMEPPE